MAGHGVHHGADDHRRLRRPRARGIANDGTLTLTSCTVSGNSAFVERRRHLQRGRRGQADADRCHHQRQFRRQFGGGLENETARPSLTGCTISGNTATLGGGGGLENASGALTLTNCTVSGNTANHGGGGLYNVFGTMTLTSCTVSGNTARNGYGGGLNNFYGDADTDQGHRQQQLGDRRWWPVQLQPFLL